jgi:hypothetical protein
LGYVGVKGVWVGLGGVGVWFRRSLVGIDKVGFNVWVKVRYFKGDGV